VPEDPLPIAETFDAFDLVQPTSPVPGEKALPEAEELFLKKKLVLLMSSITCVNPSKLFPFPITALFAEADAVTYAHT